MSDLYISRSWDAPLNELLPVDLYLSLQELNIWCRNDDDVRSVSQFIQQCRYLVTFGYKSYAERSNSNQHNVWNNVLNSCADLRHIQLYKYFQELPVDYIRQSLSAMSLEQRRRLKIRTLCLIEFNTDVHQENITDQIADLIPALKQ